MKRKKQLKIDVSLDLIVKLETFSDRFGNIRHRITCENGDKQNEFYYFRKLSSALDFINSNFE